MPFAAELAVMEQAVRAAGTALLADFDNREALLITLKGEGDYVSQADKNAERIIVDILRGAFPDYGVLGEEGGDYTDDTHARRWIVDPLDGTRNFLQGFPYWCVTIALEEDGELLAGVTYDATRDELFVAQKGHGATLNGKPIRVTQCDDLCRAMLIFNYAAKCDASKTTQTAIGAGLRQHKGVRFRHTGATALDLAYVACGRLDACMTRDIHEVWDVAAGYLLVREAGGLVTNGDLQPANHHERETLATNPALHRLITDITRNAA